MTHIGTFLRQVWQPLSVLVHRFLRYHWYRNNRCTHIMQRNKHNTDNQRYLPSAWVNIIKTH